MKRGVIIVFFCSIAVFEISGAPTQKHGPITPKLSMVASADGKDFYLDRTTMRSRPQAVTYCESLRMQLAEITSANQFLALDEAESEEWVNGSCAWIGGNEITGVRRFSWESSSLDLDPSYLPYEPFAVESNYFLFFTKYVRGSALHNAERNTACSATLCETISIDSEILQ